MNRNLHLFVVGFLFVLLTNNVMAKAPKLTSQIQSQTTLIPLSISNPTITLVKVYDGTNQCAVIPGANITGINSGDDVVVNASASYSDKNVGASKIINVVYSLTGADAGKYYPPTSFVVNTGVIYCKQLVASSPVVTTAKVYDGTTSCVATPGVLVGVVVGDVVACNVVAEYGNALVGTGKLITLHYSLTGVAASNYCCPIDYVIPNGVITPKQLTISNSILTKVKVYDGTKTASVTLGVLDGKIGGDNVSHTAGAQYQTPDVGVGKNIDVSYTLQGLDKDNYYLDAGFSANDGVILSATPVESVFSDAIQLYPNPVVDKLYIVNAKPFTLCEIFNSNGLKILEHSMVAGKNTIDCSNLTPGIYLLKLDSRVQKINKL